MVFTWPRLFGTSRSMLTETYAFMGVDKKSPEFLLITNVTRETISSDVPLRRYVFGSTQMLLEIPAPLEHHSMVQARMIAGFIHIAETIVRAGADKAPWSELPALAAVPSRTLNPETTDGKSKQLCCPRSFF
jgi:hypothetical protein